MPIRFSKPVVNQSTLAESLSLFTCQNRGRKVQNLIIYCHGYYKSKKPGVLSASDITLVPPATWFYFYAPHASVLITSLGEAIGGEFEPLEVYLSGRKVANYLLSPLQGMFGDPDFINKVILRDRLKPNKKAKKNPLREFDVIQPKWDIRLNKLIDTLQWTNNLYPRIHCLFCRESAYRKGRQWYNPADEENPNIHQSSVGRWHIL